MTVKNLNGTSDKTCPKCGSWLAHWEKLSKSSVNTCCCEGCSNNATVGAHVQKANPLDMEWYIIPLCATCNAKPSTEEFKLNKDAELVSAVKCS